VESNRITGDYNLNPFLFNRKWKVPVKTKNTVVVEQDIGGNVSELQRRLEQAEQLNQQLLAQLHKGKGPKRGKRSLRSQPSTSRFYQFTEQDNASITSDESSLNVVGADTTKTIYLKKVQLLLNGHPIDGLEGNSKIRIINFFQE